MKEVENEEAKWSVQPIYPGSKQSKAHVTPYLLILGEMLFPAVFPAVFYFFIFLVKITLWSKLIGKSEIHYKQLLFACGAFLGFWYFFSKCN